MDLFGDALRGHTDAIILSLLEEGDSYGYLINQTIAHKTNNRFSLTEATLYTAFKRLETQGLIVSYWQEGNNQVKRKYYAITQEGKKYLTMKRQSFMETTEILKTFLDK